MRYIQLMQTTQFVVFQLANFFLFFFSGKYLMAKYKPCTLLYQCEDPINFLTNSP